MIDLTAVLMCAFPHSTVVETATHGWVEVRDRTYLHLGDGSIRLKKALDDRYLAEFLPAVSGRIFEGEGATPEEAVAGLFKHAASIDEDSAKYKRQRGREALARMYGAK